MRAIFITVLLRCEIFDLCMTVTFILKSFYIFTYHMEVWCIVISDYFTICIAVILHHFDLVDSLPGRLATDIIFTRSSIFLSDLSTVALSVRNTALTELLLLVWSTLNFIVALLYLSSLAKFGIKMSRSCHFLNSNHINWAVVLKMAYQTHRFGCNLHQYRSDLDIWWSMQSAADTSSPGLQVVPKQHRSPGRWQLQMTL